MKSKLETNIYLVVLLGITLLGKSLFIIFEILWLQGYLRYNAILYVILCFYLSVLFRRNYLAYNPKTWHD